MLIGIYFTPAIISQARGALDLLCALTIKIEISIAMMVSSALTTLPLLLQRLSADIYSQRLTWTQPALVLFLFSTKLFEVISSQGITT